MRSLASRIALVSVVLVTLAVVMAVGGATLIGQRVADSAVTSSLSTSQSTQRYLQETTAREVALATDLLAADPHFTAYLVEAIRGGLNTEAGIDTRSILDQVDARRVEMGFDFAMMLDQNGDILVRTDRPLRGDESRSDHPMVASVMEELIPDYGPWREGSRLYSAAVVPVTTAFELVGFLVTGMLIDNTVANQIKQVTGVDVVFLSVSENENNSSTETVATTLDNQHSDQLQSALRGASSLSLLDGEAIERVDLRIANENWVGRAEPIQDRGGTVLGAVVTIDSLDAKLAGHRSIRNALIGAGLAAILIALVLSILVARRIAQPVKALAEVADQAAQGEYEQTIETSGKDEVGTLSRAISRLLADLREQKEIAAYVSELSRHLEHGQLERGDSSTANGSNAQASGAEDERGDAIKLPPSGPAIIIALEWLAGENISESATLDSLQRWLPKLAELAQANGARIAPGGGAKLYLIFSQGQQSGLISTLGQLHKLLDQLEASPAMALACGEIVSSGLNLGPTRSPVITGKPIFHCERLLAEAGMGRMLVSPLAFKQLKSTIESAGAGGKIVEGIRSQKKFWQLTPWPTVDMAAADTLPIDAQESTGKSAPLSPLRVGSVLGDRYEILELLGAGAMGTVFKALDRKLDDVVALKLLPTAVLDDDEHLEQMKSEIRIARKITHPNVLRTHDLWEQDGQPVISMEYVRGIALSQLLERSGKLKLAAGLRVCSQVLKGLAAAHQVGVLHRDIKPANIILDQSGNARLMDFGISHPIRSSSSGTDAPAKIMGTANYMAPEIVSGGEIDERSDLYAMGVMMYEVFTGALPFKSGTALEVCMAHLKQQAPPPAEHWPDIPRGLEQIIMTCMSKNPEQRYANAEVLLSQLLKMRRQSAAATVGI